ncbi:MAG: aminodeoxychorismate/anthranilate synthase component II [Crocinitomicaceae bacterium]
MQQILLLDNFDSFTYNLEHYLNGLGAQVNVVRNNVPISDISLFDKIVLSPGPGLPEEAGFMLDIIERADGKIPVLGVCLGMQGIAVHLGGEIYNQQIVKHGVMEEIDCSDSHLFHGIPKRIEVGLYHSWAVKDHANYTTTAKSSSGILMGIENVDRKLYGVQFHPESVMTPNGKDILKNFLGIV